MHTLIDGWIVLALAEPDKVDDIVQNWRLQAEKEMRAAGRPGLSDEEVQHATFISLLVSDHVFFLLLPCIKFLPSLVISV